METVKLIQNLTLVMENTFVLMWNMTLVMHSITIKVKQNLNNWIQNRL